LVNFGTVSPGNSIGTMTVANYTHGAGAALRIEINAAGQSDLLHATGTAQINGGTVNVAAQSGTYHVGTTYTFLRADGGVTGTFDAITDDLPFLDAMLLYGADYVAFMLESGRNYESEAATQNQHAVAGYLDTQKSGATGDFATVLDNLNSLDGAGARLAFDAMGGEVYGSLATVGIETNEQFLRTISQRLQSQAMARGFDDYVASNRMKDNLTYVSCRECEPCTNRWTTWAQGYGIGANMASDGNASGLKYTTGGLAIGAERNVSCDTAIGFVGGYSSSYTTLDDRGDTGSIDGGQAALYLHHEAECSYITGIAAYGYNSYNTTRHIEFAEIDRTAHANYGGNNFSFYTEAGRTLYGQYIHLQPYAGLEYIQVYQNEFTETGADSIDIAAGGQRASAFRGLLGSRVFSNFRNSSNGQMLTLEGRAAWRHEFLNESRVLDASFAGQIGGTFAIAGLNVDRDTAIMGLGATYHLTTAFAVFANYDVAASQNYTAHVGSGGLQYAW
jgi:uncharacterized protein with beta-barrel porin domain